MPLPKLFQRESPGTSVAPQQGLQAEIEKVMRRRRGQCAAASQDAGEGGLRREALHQLQRSLQRCLAVETAVSSNPVQVDGLWFSEEHFGSGETHYWLCYFCHPCQSCGTIAEAFRLDCISPYEKAQVTQTPEQRAQHLERIGTFIEETQSGKRRHLCPDCKLSGR